MIVVGVPFHGCGDQINRYCYSIDQQTMLASSEDFLVALCRAHSEWDSENNIDIQPLLRTLREGAQGLIKDTSPEMIICLNEIVKILCHQAPIPLGDTAKNEVMILTDKLVWARAAVDDGFLKFISQLCALEATSEPRPVVVVSASSSTPVVYHQLKSFKTTKE